MSHYIIFFMRLTQEWIQSLRNNEDLWRMSINDLQWNLKETREMFANYIEDTNNQREVNKNFTMRSRL